MQDQCLLSVFHIRSLQNLLGGHTSTTQCLRPLRAEGFKGALDAPSSRCSSAEERLNPRPSPPSTITGPIDGRLSDHNGEDVGSKPTAGITFNSPALQKLDSAKSATNPNPLHKEGCGELRFPFTYRGGAEDARGAHNSEDVGSKPTPGIFFRFKLFFVEKN